MEKIFFNGTIITMTGKESPDAILVRNGKIAKIGTWKEIEKEKSKDAELIDLKQRTLMPAFIDSHSHITALAQTIGLIDLSHCRKFQDIIEKLKGEKEKQKIEDGKWMIGFGYDHNLLEEKNILISMF